MAVLNLDAHNVLTYAISARRTLSFYASTCLPPPRHSSPWSGAKAIVADNGHLTKLCKIASQLQQYRPGGFYTEEIRQAGQRKGFRLVTFRGEEGIIAHVKFFHRYRVSKYGVDIPTIDRFAETELALTDAVDVYLIDKSGKFEYHRWQANLRILEIEPVKTVPYTPVSHAFVARLIGTIRREFLDQTLFWNAVDLERKLEAFQDYYNHSRLHSSLDGDTPAKVSGESKIGQANLQCYCWESHCHGLFQLPIAA